MGTPVGAIAPASEAGKPRRHASIKARVDCRECGQPVPLDGPLKKAHCNMCQSDFPVKPGLWQSVLEEAENRHETLVGGAVHGDKVRQQGVEMTFELRVAVPACEQCGAAFPGEAVSTLEELQFCCTGCGDPASTYPMPTWLKQRVPAAVQVVSTDVVIPSVGSEGAAVVRPAEEAPRPVVMACPQCAGSLSIGVDSLRMHTCEFCGTDVYLPDGVWLRLHPVKKVREFFVGFAGPTPLERKREDQAQREENKHQEQLRRQAKKHAEETYRRQQSEAATSAANQQREQARQRLIAGHNGARPLVIIAWVATLVYAGLGILHLSLPAARLPASVAGPNMWRMFVVVSVVAGLCLAVAFIKPVQLLNEYGFYLGVKGVLALAVPLVTLLVALHAIRGSQDFEGLHPEIPGVAPASRPFGYVMAALNVQLGLGLFWLLLSLQAAKIF